MIGNASRLETATRQMRMSYLPNLPSLGMCELHAPYCEKHNARVWYRVYGRPSRNGMCYSYGQLSGT